MFGREAAFGLPLFFGLAFGGHPIIFNNAGTGSDSTSDKTAKTDTSKSKANPTSVDCAAVTPKNACSYDLSYESEDLEWWDVGMAISVPGVKETQYSLSSSNVVQAKTTTHNDVYALVDLFSRRLVEAERLIHPALRPRATDRWKNFLSTGVWSRRERHKLDWIGKEKFPVRMSLVGGVVYMKESVPRTLQVGATATASQLTSDLSSKRVTKPWFGVELSVNALVSKIKK